MDILEKTLTCAGRFEVITSPTHQTGYIISAMLLCNKRSTCKIDHWVNVVVIAGTLRRKVPTHSTTDYAMVLPSF